MTTNRFRLTTVMLLALLPVGEVWSDSVAKNDGTLVTGAVIGLQDGSLRIQTPGGIQNIPLETVKAFAIEEKQETGGVSEESVNRILAAQDQIMQRLDLLTQSLANLERQLLNVQAHQQISADRLTQRTQEVNPLGRLVVGAYQVNRVTGKTVVTGQIMNQSETPVSNVQVDVFISGSSGKIRAEGGQKKMTVFSQPPALAPGQVGTFTAQFRDLYQVDNVTFDVRGLPPYGYSVNPPTGRAATGDF